MNKIAHFEILDPPTKYIYQQKRKPNETLYLTNNLFYGGAVHWVKQRAGINFAKDFLILYLRNIPKLLKMRLELIYYAPSPRFDLDNKAGFWVKMLLDLLREPSEKELYNAHIKNKTIKTVNVIPDDNCKYVDDIRIKYKRGPHKIEIIIHGIKKGEQKELF